MPEQQNKFSNKQKLAIVWCMLMSCVIFACCGVLIVNFQNSNTDNSSNTSGRVAGAQDVITPTIKPTTIVKKLSTTVTATPIIKYLGTFAGNTKITLSGKLPILCLNTDGNFCKAAMTQVGTCHNGVCAATQLNFTVVPDANGNWSYSIPEGLDPGDYEVTIKDASGKVLEVTKFTVTSKTKSTNLPNTGIMEDILMPSIIILLITIFSAVLITKKRNKIVG
ncbi:MAG: LPXTG cell wall anchor domain-containing protein [bacterium]